MVKAKSTSKTTKSAAAKKHTTTAKKRTTAPKTAKKSSARTPVRESRTKDFMVIQFTRDTLYWLIFGLVTIVFVVWVMSLQYQVNDLYDQINAEQMSAEAAEQELKLYSDKKEAEANKQD